MRNDFCRWDSGSPAVRALPRAVPALYPGCPPLGLAMGKLNAQRPGTSLGHTANAQPLASAVRQRPQMGGPRTEPHPEGQSHFGLHRV